MDLNEEYLNKSLDEILYRKTDIDKTTNLTIRATKIYHKKINLYTAHDFCTCIEQSIELEIIMPFAIFKLLQTKLKQEDTYFPGHFIKSVLSAKFNWYNYNDLWKIIYNLMENEIIPEFLEEDYFKIMDEDTNLIEKEIVIPSIALEIMYMYSKFLDFKKT